MSEPTPSPPPPYTKPEGSRTEHVLPLPGGELRYRAMADWIVLRDRKEQPKAEVFHVAYLAECDDPASRPITFVFNGGPGAASAYLHLGALGPRRVAFRADGTAPPPPARLVDNAESWLPFTDLVFIDPVGTGFSRIVPDPAVKKKPGAPDAPRKPEGPEPAEQEFYGLNKDLAALGEFAGKFLSAHHRWTSPAFVAGESYGGFRAARLARLLQEGHGIGLNGVMLISPALEWTLLSASDYDVLYWIGAFPSMAAAAARHGRSSAFGADAATGEVLREAERFAAGELVALLVGGEAIEEQRRTATLSRMAELCGLDQSLLRLRGARLDILVFARELLRDRRRICGLYDASVTAVDPFPDREKFEGPDPTLFAIERVFTGGINSQLREVLGVATDRDYKLLNMEVNTSWKVDAERHVFDVHVGATDDLRYGMALNPHMQVLLAHGIYDLVTPYYASERITRLMKLDDELRGNLHVRRFDGGHMFYTWDSSRRAFRDQIAAFYARAVL